MALLTAYEILEGSTPAALKVKVDAKIALAGTDWEPYGEPFIRSKDGQTIFYQAMINGTLSGSASSLAQLDGITAGTVTASKAVVVDSNKDIGDFRNLDATNFDAGLSGTAGTVDIFPATAAKGKIQIAAADSAGDTTTTITNASQAGARTYTIPDGGASANFVLSTGTSTATTATSTELNFVAGVTAGTAAASKAVVLDGSKGIATITSATITTLTSAAHRNAGAGQILITQVAQTAKTTSATLTAAELLTGIITVNQGAGGASVLTLPLATDLDTSLSASVANDAFDFSVINISTVAAEDASVATNTGWTLVGNMDVASNAAATDKSAGRFRARKTGAGAWTLYRLS